MSRVIETPKYETVGEIERFDEADNTQALGELMPDSEDWKRYYKERPELEKQIRALLKLPGKDVNAPMPDFAMVAGLRGAIRLNGREDAVDGAPAPRKTEMEPARATAKVKGLSQLLGADIVKIGPLNQAWVYTHVGRSHSPDKPIGPPINLPHQHVIVFAVALDQDMFRCSVQVPSTLDVMSKYLRLASLSVGVAGYIRSLGYSARAHNVSNYQVIIPAVAVDAGIGELSRNGIVVNEKYGSAIKMSAVTTDMPLLHDKPVDIGVEEYCRECHLCADYCPVNAIPRGDKTVTRGVRKWQLNDMACYSRFLQFNCSICVAVCPWSRPRHFPHNAILKAVQSSALLRRLAIKLDNIFGDHSIKKCPEWFDEPFDSWRKGLRSDHPYYSDTNHSK